MAVSILNELQNQSSPEKLIEALRSLKNEIVGHSQRKELWIRRGLVAHLKRILDTHRASSKQRRKDESSNSNHRVARSVEEEARLQAITVASSLAHGGPAFITPLRRGRIYLPLLQVISPAESSPALVLAALRCLNAIADATALEYPAEDNEEDEFFKTLYTDIALANLNSILLQDNDDPTTQQQITLVLELISKTSNTEERRKRVKISGVFNTLSWRLANFVVARPGRLAQRISESPGISHANPKAKLAPLLHAICSIIADSKIRASVFCCYSVWTTLFPQADRDPYAWRVPASRSAASGSAGMPSVLDVFSSKSSKETKTRRSFGSSHVGTRVHRSHSIGNGDSAEVDSFNHREDDDTPLIVWLIDIVRETTGFTQLMATWLIGILFRSQMISIRRQRNLLMLLVPILVSAIDGDQLRHRQDSGSVPPARIQNHLMKEIAPKVLALFVTDNAKLQKGAVDGGAIAKLSQLLKKSFDPIPASLLTPMWNARGGEDETAAMEVSETDSLGRPGVQPIVHHILRIRESLLLAIAAMATLEDGNRAAITQSGVVPFVVESLRPGEKLVNIGIASGSLKPGNSVPVLVAACKAATTLARSVIGLRTSLPDAGIAKPVFALMKHADIRVQIAATNAVVNFGLPFSAMQSDFTEAGVLQLLRQYAHSSNLELSTISFMALSNFISEANNDLKISIIRELGIGWLKQKMCDGTEEGAEASQNHELDAFGMANASGEHVGLLNTTDDRSQHYLFEHETTGDVNMIGGTALLHDSDNIVHNARYPGFTSTSDKYFDAGADERTAAIETAKNELKIQEQALILIRNLLAAPENSIVVNFLFRELGQDELFEMLANLLRPRSMDGFRGFQEQRPGTVSASRWVPPPTEIVSQVVYILVHIAASETKHRQILCAQKDLLKLLLPLYEHPSAEVRVTCVWIVINLTWQEDAADKLHCRNRTAQLKQLGFLAKLQEVEHDTEMDVKERAKQATAQIRQVLGE